MPAFDRISLDPDVMGGKPCIRGIRVTVGTILGLLASGHTEEEILKAYPYLEKEDIRAALAYATWRVKRLRWLWDADEERAKRGTREKFEAALERLPDVQPAEEDRL